ncbi:sugar ABC transporter permease [Microbacterium saperdae]|nr:sugar ABC transporter permease [Microbacterium saperdae]
MSPTYRVLRLSLTIVCGLIMALPIFYMVSRSFMTAQEVQAFPATLFPAELQWSNYAKALEFITPQVLWNSVFFSLGVLVLQLVLCLPAAFALAKIPFRWTGLVLAVLVVPMFVPGNFTLIPTFVITYQLGWLNSWAGLIVPVAAQIAFGVLLFRQFFAGLPNGLTEAARLDGAGWFRVFWSVMLPLAKPALATYCSITFLGAWNQYIWPLVTATDPGMTVINVALAPLAAGQYSTASPAVGLAGAAIAMLPVLLVFLALQKWYVKGVAGSGLE